MKPRQWPWYVLQIAVFCGAMALMVPHIEQSHYGAASLYAIFTAFTVTLAASGLIRLGGWLSRFVPGRSVEHQGQPSSQDLSLSSPLRTLRDRTEEATGLRVSQDTREFPEIASKLPTVPRISKHRD